MLSPFPLHLVALIWCLSNLRFALLQMQVDGQHRCQLLLFSPGVHISSLRSRSPLDAGCWGLSRSVRSELPDISVRCIDGDLRQASIYRLWLPASDGSVELRQQETELMLWREVPFVPRLQGLQAQTLVKLPPSVPSSLQIVTGGLGGIGLVTARWLAQCHRSALMLTSRSGALGVLSDVQFREWEQLLAASRATFVARSDVAEPHDVSRLIALVLREESQVEGVWHSAGVLSDALLSRQGAATLVCVYAPKSHGALMLQAACGTGCLSTCTLFSSISGLVWRRWAG